LLLGVTAAHVLALAASRFLPFVDLPQHVAAARIAWNLHNPDLARLYEVNWLPQVNVLALLFGAPLHAVLPEGAAVRVLVILGIAGLAWALLRLAQAAGRPAWGAIAAMPFALHFGWMYGFLSFGLGIPILLLVLARLAGALEDPRPRWRPTFIDAFLWWLLLLAHALLFAFGAAAAVIWMALPGRDRIGRWRRPAAILPAALWALAWWVHTRAVVDRLDPGAGSGGIEAFWHDAPAKLLMAGQSLIVAGTDGRIEWTVLASLGLVATLLLVLELRSRESSPARRFLRVTALLALLAYAFLPFSVYPRERVTYGLFLLYPRFLVLVPLVLFPTLRWPTRARIAMPLVLLLCAANVAVVGRQFTLFQQVAAEARGLDAAVEAIPPGRVVKSLVYTPRPPELRYPAFLHAASYYQARTLGETDQSFALLPTNPVHYRDLDRPYLSRRDEHLRPHEFDARRAAMYDFVLVYDREGRWRPRYASWGRPPVVATNGWIVLGPP
jgi:hypothetical protein